MIHNKNDRHDDDNNDQVQRNCMKFQFLPVKETRAMTKKAPTRIITTRVLSLSKLIMMLILMLIFHSFTITKCLGQEQQKSETFVAEEKEQHVCLSDDGTCNSQQQVQHQRHQTQQTTSSAGTATMTTTTTTATSNAQHQQQQQQQQQDNNNANTNQRRIPAKIIETINMEYGQPQVILNEYTDITKQHLQHIQNYLMTYPKWKKTCFNHHHLCTYWAATKECAKNPAYMKKYCAASCQLCTIPEEEGEQIGKKQQEGQSNPPTSKSIQQQNKDTYDESYIPVTIPYGLNQNIPTKNSDLAVQRIAKMYTYMRSVVFVEEKYSTIKLSCQNQHNNCAHWASLGECENNAKYMKRHCAPVCFSCETLTYEYRCPFNKTQLETTAALRQPNDLNNKFERILQNFQHLTPIVLSSPSHNPLKRQEHQKNKNENSNDENNNSDDTNMNKSDDDDETIPSGGPWVVQFDTFATTQECERLIYHGNQLGYNVSLTVGPALPNGTVLPVISQHVRTSMGTWCHEACQHDPIIRKLFQRMEHVLDIPMNHSESLQLLKYEQNQFYRKHHDYLDHQKNRPQGVRILTLFVYLNDVDDGGETNFPHLDIKVTPKIGRAVLWPSVLNDSPNVKDFRTEHEALEVKHGIKYGANAWIHQYDYQTPFLMDCV